MSPLRLLTVALCLLPCVASAHVALTDPVPRSGDNGLTMMPCGGVAAVAPIALMAGDMISVSWAVGQAHGGSLTIDFSPGDDMGFDSYVLASDVSDEEGMPTSMDVQLPDLDCDACTLRLVQVNPDRESYYSCADVSLSGASSSSSESGSSGGEGSSSGGSSGGSSEGGPADSSSSGGGDESSDGGSVTASGTATTSATGATATAGESSSAGTDTSAGNDDSESSGCSCNAAATPAPWLLVVFAGLCVRRRSRR
jgi:MYXO-CTERM domain-containing protein